METFVYAYTKWLIHRYPCNIAYPVKAKIGGNDCF